MEILDASALISFLKREKEGAHVAQLLRNNRKAGKSVFIHQINFAEVVYHLFKKHGEDKAKRIIANLQSPFLGISNYMSTDIALYASTLKAACNISLGDAMGLAFTKIMNGRFWTKDKELVQIGVKEKIEINFIG